VTANNVSSLHSGDINNNGVLDLGDLAIMARILFRDPIPEYSVATIDSDCDSDFDLVDLVGFINVLFHGAETACR
jgi:hypothetical protein